MIKDQCFRVSPTDPLRNECNFCDFGFYFGLIQISDHFLLPIECDYELQHLVRFLYEIWLATPITIPKIDISTYNDFANENEACQQPKINICKPVFAVRVRYCACLVTNFILFSRVILTF